MDACVEGTKRQLPSWMMPPKVGASNVSNSGNVVESNCSTENEDIIVANLKKNDHKKETLKRTRPPHKRQKDRKTPINTPLNKAIPFKNKYIL
jgi:hypothetical protein